jgi:hypothetical protein
MAERLRDIIDIPEIKPVIELDDADTIPDAITSSFVLTREVEEGLRVILTRVNAQKGCGVFLKGNYGSGKSHFLSYLFLLLKEGITPLLADFPEIKAGNINPVKISLVKYTASLPLERIILDSCSYTGGGANRQEQFREIVDRPTVILIDELSEFLRAKPAAPAFYEDIRFLQFLGEFSFHHPLWVIASLQEWIEETGHISSNIFNRIKDRYPVRVNLSSSHIEDIIDQRIVIKKEGAESVIRNIFDELKHYYPALHLRYEDFRKTYPLHPFTARYLSGLTPVFSQHRGVIQFVFSEVKKAFDDPPSTLITPEAIFDHFEERIREIPEYSPLARVIYDYYRGNIGMILSQPVQQETALAVIKLLALTEISPFEKRKNAKEIAELLLKKVSTLTSQINYDYIKSGILDPLVAHQMYVNREGEHYFLDTTVDEGIRARGKIKAVRERFADRNVLFSEICGLIALPYLPLRDIREGKRYRFTWQNSPRECVVLTASPLSLKREGIENMIEGIQKRIDGFLVILSPFAENIGIDAWKDANASPFLAAVVFWVPRSPNDEEAAFIEEFIAKKILAGEFPALGSDLRRDEAEFREIVTRWYFDGEVIYGSGKRVDNIRDIGYLPIERLLSHLFDYSLSELYPNHARIMPRVDYISSQHLHALFQDFIRQGRITIEEAEKKGLVPYINALPEPLGIVAKRGSSFLVSLDPANELVSHILTLSSKAEGVAHIRAALKKGKWGMMDDQINLALAAFITSGHLIPYGRDEMVELKELSQLTSGEISKLKQGKTLPAELLAYIPAGRFIWGEVEDIPTPITQKLMWKLSTDMVRRGRRLLDDINGLINKYKDYSLFKKAAIDNSLLNRLSMFLHSITLSQPPAEGLERFLSYLKEIPEMEGEIDYVERLSLFLSEQFQIINKYWLYLIHPALELPPDLREKRNVLVSQIEDFLRAYTGDFDGIKEQWEVFFDEYTRTYKESHEKYYSAAVFAQRNAVDELSEAKALKRIATLVGSVTFPGEWWELKRGIDHLPEACRHDLNSELFLNPACGCGFTIGDTPPEIEADFTGSWRKGLRNFLAALKTAENREKLDSFALSLHDAGRQDLAARFTSLINLDAGKVNISLMLPLLADEVLTAIEKALKGRWKVRDLDIADFIGKVKGKRFRHEELKRLFLGWIGDDEDSIIHIREEHNAETVALRESLCRYGAQGEALFRSLAEGDHRLRTYEDMEEALKKEGGFPSLDVIRWGSYNDDELLDFLKKERIGYLKKQIRKEVFQRLSGKIIPAAFITSVEDRPLAELLSIARIFAEREKYRGVEVFTRAIAPLTCRIAALRYENIDEVLIEGAGIDALERNYRELLASYEKRPDRFDGALDIAAVSGRMKGVVAVMDGLRYDLWLILKDVLENEGRKLREHPFVIPPPTSTSHFRKLLGIAEEGEIDGRISLLKWSERGFHTREFNRFLKGSAETKVLHFNFIDAKVHNSILDIYPLYLNIKSEFIHGIVPILKSLPRFILIADHGFVDTGRMKERYTHGGSTIWETVLPFVEVK